MQEIKIRPLADRVVVQPEVVAEVSKGGIIIPDNAKEKPQKGTVVAIGTGKKDEPLTVKVGDEILYGKFSGNDITINEQIFLIMREADIFAIL